jgi:predicted nucleotidyltransferase
VKHKAAFKGAAAAPSLKPTDLPVIDEGLIGRVYDRIAETFDPEAVYLFGSAARGESRPGSDLDLLVVMNLPQGTSNLAMSRRIRALFRGWRLPLDIIVLEPQAFEEWQTVPGHVASLAVHEGRMLHG